MSDAGTTRRFVFHGRVQGVGFRWTTQRVAGRFPVAGFVRNQPDGTVELVVSAESDVITRFVAAVEAAMPGHVDRCEETDPPVAGSFESFVIRR